MDRPSELDARTLERARRGEAEACRALVVRYQGLVFHTASRVLGRDAHDLEDVSQDALVKVLRALGDFDPAGPARLSTWVATVTARTAVDARRTRRNVVSLDAARELHDRALKPDEALDEARERARLAEALERLDPTQRAAMVLRVEHGLSYEAIAEELKLETGTVKSRLSRAKSALLAALAPTSTRSAP